MLYRGLPKWCRKGKNGSSGRFNFGGLQNYCDGDFSHETKRCLLFGRKAMTNLDSILKNRDTTLSREVHTVKAMTFSTVMYGRKSWIIKIEHKRVDAFERKCCRRLLSPLDCEEIKQCILKEINPEYLLEGLMLKLKLQYFGYLM